MSTILSAWGLTDSLGDELSKHLDGLTLGRILAEHKERYLVATEGGEVSAEVTGHLRYTAQSRVEFPVVGDWVAIMPFDDQAIIHSILPRSNLLQRKASGKKTEVQPIVSNIDFGTIVMGLTEDYNLHRLDRYIALLKESQINPIVLLTKSDLVSVDECRAKCDEINERHDCPVFALDNMSRHGYENWLTSIQAGQSVCLIGSSGVGKTTIVNNITGTDHLTLQVSDHTRKGKHSTTHRQMFRLPNGAILVDTPGMREVGLVGTESVEHTFEGLEALFSDCRYADCDHVDTPGCAVVEAVQNGEIEEDVYAHFLKLRKEAAHFERSQLEKRQHDRDLHKMYRKVQEMNRKNKG